MSRCFPEPAPLMAAYRLHRGIDRRDVARAHRLALDRIVDDCSTYVISAPPPFVREDSHGRLEDAASVIRRRAPEVALAFDKRGWPLPSSIGRVYSPARAAAELGFTAAFGAVAAAEGDCDPTPAA
jgi:nucleoside-diphosphate-sugar epimerase